ncbi:caspase family protein [Amaricoccus sp.]|uniref:caspase family protein n=1 Tax=Amaricoccus sp. TaxID=1872485 RepID=UPI001B633A50|nr:caspase family protein [Amaricoccus sp.]MBP7242731.1 caspase family protein [Amaricoccus sp.]
MWLRRLGFALAVLVLAGAAALAETRVALVIGNAGYTALPPLKNPVVDAGDIADSLRRLGFTVTLGTDLGRDAMTKTIAQFETEAAQADVSLFYYAGHGFQIDARNYLLPVDAALAGPQDVARWAVPLDAATAGLAGGPGVHLVFLDACRDNPLRGLGDPERVAEPDGLARVGDAAGFLYVFATQPDNVAYDGLGRNSYFAAALLAHLETPGQDVASTLIAVRRDVLAATGGKQIPWENSSLTREFAFVPGDESAPLDTLLWQVASAAGDPALAEIYRDRFPDGAHAGEAAAFLRTAPAARSLDRPLAPSLADALWEVARRLRLRALVEAYLARDPEGRHAADASQMLATLPPDDAETPERLCERLATHPRDATASIAGVPFAALEGHARAAIAACGKAAAAHPEAPHFTALLARATAAAGDMTAAERLYRDAAGRGDVRAMNSLGQLVEEKDPVAAIRWYERAAEGGGADGAINLAVALRAGTIVPRDDRRAVALLQAAADDGSAIATYNLGVLAQDGVAPGGDPAALAFFRRAISLGEPRGNLAAAFLLEHGEGVAHDPAATAAYLLAGSASDGGEAQAAICDNPLAWSPETVRIMQDRLARRGLYDGPLDGRIGPRLVEALDLWRMGGMLARG